MKVYYDAARSSNSSSSSSTSVQMAHDSRSSLKVSATHTHTHDGDVDDGHGIERRKATSSSSTSKLDPPSTTTTSTTTTTTTTATTTGRSSSSVRWTDPFAEDLRPGLPAWQQTRPPTATAGISRLVQVAEASSAKRSAPTSASSVRNFKPNFLFSLILHSR